MMKGVIVGALFITIVLTILVIKMADANAARAHMDQQKSWHQ